MRRFVTVVALLFFTLPFGISITGCGKKSPPVFCNGGDTGAVTGQLTTITLQPKLFGLSINQSQISQTSSPTSTDCKGSPVSVSAYVYASTDLTLVDIAPTTGRLCGGSWNRNSSGGIADFTTCTPTGRTGVAYITATADGITSNSIPVYVHPTITSVVLGPASPNCNVADPATNCSPAAVNSAVATSAVAGCPTTAQFPSNPQLANGCCTIAPGVVFASTVTPVTPYTATGCLSQGVAGQLSAQVFAAGAVSTSNPTGNVSCQVGHLTYAPQTANVVTIDQNGVATANQPGSTIITSSFSEAGSTAGFFSTCPPVDIALTFPQTSAGTTNVVVAPNTTQTVSAVVTDQNGVQLTGLTLEYVSTTPTTIPAASTGSVTPIFPGEADITAICQPPACNPAPYSEIGLFGNGKAITSGAVSVTVPGTNSTDLYIGSTNSRYIVPVDFTQTNLGSPIQLPYQPNSMVISDDGSSIYMGSTTELMVLSALTGAISRQDDTVPGTVLAVSPNSSDIVISDPVKQQTYIYSSTGTVVSSYGGVGTAAAWSPDSEAVYISAGNQVLVYSLNTGWSALSPATPSGNPVSAVTVTVPAAGAYFGGATTTARGYCPITSLSGSTTPPTATNQFYPPADTAAIPTDQLAATSDGLHILGAAASTDTLTDFRVDLAPIAATGNPVGSLSPSGGISCPSGGGPLAFTHQTAPLTLTGVTPTAITSILPTSNASYDFVTYTGTGGVLPAYAPVATQAGTVTPGTLTNIPLSGSAIAPVAGAISADNSTVYIGTSGDNLVHIISITGASPLTDTRTIAPNLPALSGTGFATPNLLVQKPRPTT